MIDPRAIRIVRRGKAPWMVDRWFGFMDIGGAAGLLVGPWLITWVKL